MKKIYQSLTDFTEVLKHQSAYINQYWMDYERFEVKSRSLASLKKVYRLAKPKESLIVDRVIERKPSQGATTADQTQAADRLEGVPQLRDEDEERIVVLTRLDAFKSKVQSDQKQLDFKPFIKKFNHYVADIRASNDRFTKGQADIKKTLDSINDSMRTQNVDLFKYMKSKQRGAMSIVKRTQSPLRSFVGDSSSHQTTPSKRLITSSLQFGDFKTSPSLRYTESFRFPPVSKQTTSRSHRIKHDWPDAQPLSSPSRLAGSRSGLKQPSDISSFRLKKLRVDRSSQARRSGEQSHISIKNVDS